MILMGNICSFLHRNKTLEDLVASLSIKLYVYIVGVVGKNQSSTITTTQDVGGGGGGGRQSV